ncbi:MAG: class I SAM-dependent methyltransferase [Gemmatimonadaceae bacterium]
MAAKEWLKSSLGRGVQLVTMQGAWERRHQHNVELAIAATIAGESFKRIRYPVEYVEFLRACSEHTSYSIRDVKADTAGADSAANRFATLLDVLQSGAPPIDIHVAQDIGQIADEFRCLTDPLDHDHWSGDVGLHFALSSGLARTGRILTCIIRYMRSERCLELGTAYGTSAAFMLEALKSRGDAGRLATVEPAEPQFTLASTLLERRYGGRVSCHRGLSYEVIPSIVQSLQRVDFMFHDASHTGEDFIRDFDAVEPALAPGAVVMFDDIHWDSHWNNSRFFQGEARTYEGWMQIVRHQRVRRAVEMSDTMGMLLLR